MIEAGTSIEPQDFPEITLEQLKAYALAADDPNPIHQDEAVAKAMGLPGVIAHGMLTAAFVAERAQLFAEEKLGQARLSSFQSRFRAMVRVGDVVSVGGTVKSITDTEIVLDLQARTPRGETAVTAEARFIR